MVDKEQGILIHAIVSFDWLAKIWIVLGKPINARIDITTENDPGEYEVKASFNAEPSIKNRQSVLYRWFYKLVNKPNEQGKHNGPNHLS